MSELTPLRIYDFNLVPSRLLEQLKLGMPVNLDMMRRMGHAAVQTGLSVLYVFADEKHVIRGFMWLTVSPVTESLYVDAVSFDPEFQDGKTPHELIKPILRATKQEFGAKNIFTMTRTPRAAKKHGWQTTRVYLMKVGPAIEEGEESWAESQALSAEG